MDYKVGGEGSRLGFSGLGADLLSMYTVDMFSYH